MENVHPIKIGNNRLDCESELSRRLRLQRRIVVNHDGESELTMRPSSCFGFGVFSSN
ncbi:uncharacterized protein G2W53_018035 [Senna tora]|uniref:Uncharacterized protein n=1 Tax=Senna tora TaxID=362788 RepID=A0A834TTV5_9FABA|nr:uncharacterized protein G2W53_018035 [Senna tora]